jgi:hypothetical protein
MIMTSWFSKEFCYDEAQYFKSSGEAEMSMAMLPLPPRLTRREHRGGEVAIGFLAVNAKKHVSEQKFNVRKYKTMRLDESYRLVTTVLVLNSHCGKIHNIFLTTIAA